MESEPVLRNVSGDEEEIDTDLETDRLLGGGHQRLEDHGFYDDKVFFVDQIQIWRLLTYLVSDQYTELV